MTPLTPSGLARLAVRLAAEEAYRGGAVSAVLPAVEAAWNTGDAHALAEALSLAHHAHLLGDRAAVGALEELRVRADALRCRACSRPTVPSRTMARFTRSQRGTLTR